MGPQRKQRRRPILLGHSTVRGFVYCIQCRDIRSPTEGEILIFDDSEAAADSCDICDKPLNRPEVK